MQFSYDAELLRRCPELVAGVIWAEGLTNQAFTDAGDQTLAAAEGLIHRRFSDVPQIARSESITAWRQVYSRFGVTPNRYPCAAEALMRRVVESASLPRICAIVDICNAASLTHGIPVAPFDIDVAGGDWTVRLATGTETFLPIGSTHADPVPAGEVIYVDDSGRARSRRWNWRQSDDGKITLKTTSLLITTEAVHVSARETVRGVLANLAEWIPEILGGRVQTEVLDIDHPSSERTLTA